MKVYDAKITFEVNDFDVDSTDEAYDKIDALCELVEDFLDKIDYQGFFMNQSDVSFKLDPIPEDSGVRIVKVERKNILESLNLFGVKK